MRLVKSRVSNIGAPAFYKVVIKSFTAVALLLSTLFAFADDFPARPNPPRLVTDLAGMLSTSENQALEDKLVAFNDSTSTQISVVIITSLGMWEKAEYATELGERWGIGRKDKDNGVLVLIAKDERQIFIATGRGVEEFLPDAVCKRIVENII